MDSSIFIMDSSIFIVCLLIIFGIISASFGLALVDKRVGSDEKSLSKYIGYFLNFSAFISSLLLVINIIALSNAEYYEKVYAKAVSIQQETKADKDYNISNKRLKPYMNYELLNYELSNKRYSADLYFDRLSGELSISKKQSEQILDSDRFAIK